MRTILATIVLFLFIGCSATTNEIDDAMEPFMTKNFPEATYNITIEDQMYQLVINDKGDAISKGKVEPLMTETLGQFFASFYQTSNSDATDSKLMVAYKSEAFSWKSDQYDFDQLGKIFRLEIKK